MASADDSCLASSQVDVSHGSQLLQLKRQSHAATPHLDPESNFLDVFLGNSIAPLSNNKSCLKFLHIPKNAGTTIGLVLHEPAGVGWGNDGAPHYPQCSQRVDNAPEYECQIHDSAGNVGFCLEWYVPPVFDPVVAVSYEGCTTFCIARHPLTRAISQYHWGGAGWNPQPFKRNASGMCGEEHVKHFAEFIDSIVDTDALSTSPYAEDCHWVPQSVYIGQEKYCQRVLKYENLKADFNALMGEYEIPITLGDAHANPASCDYLSKHLHSIPVETLQKIETMFAADYKEFGYERYPAPA